MSTVETEPSVLPSSATGARAAVESVAVVETRDLTRRYGEATAVDGLNFRLETGEVFGLLGPNGAGKTTTILMIMGLTEPTSGTVRVLGYDPARDPLKVKRLGGYLPQHLATYDQPSA